MILLTNSKETSERHDRVRDSACLLVDHDILHLAEMVTGRVVDFSAGYLAGGDDLRVLIKLFQNEGPLWGILGIICGIYTLVWGWMNADKLNIRKIMMIWTILIVAQIILYFLVGGSMLSSGMMPATN